MHHTSVLWSRSAQFFTLSPHSIIISIHTPPTTPLTTHTQTRTHLHYASFPSQLSILIEYSVHSSLHSHPHTCTIPLYCSILIISYPLISTLHIYTPHTHINISIPYLYPPSSLTDITHLNDYAWLISIYIDTHTHHYPVCHLSLSLSILSPFSILLSPLFVLSHILLSAYIPAYSVCGVEYIHFYCVCVCEREREREKEVCYTLYAHPYTPLPHPSLSLSLITHCILGNICI